MYLFILHLHNVLRWLVILAAVFSIIRAFNGWSGKKPWTKLDNISGIVFSSIADLQLVIGIVLYFFLSPLTKIALGNMGEAMKNSELRFYAVEHIIVMVIAIVLIHLGRTKAKKATDPIARHRISAIFYTLAFLLVMAAIPWSRALL